MRTFLAIGGATVHALAALLVCACVVGPTASATRADIRVSSGTLVDHATPEGAVSIGGALVLLAVGRFTVVEAGTLPAAMYDAYDEMGPAPSLVVAELTGGADAEIWIEPDDPTDLGIVFLHGYGGNFTVNCWQFAQAAPGARTVCPSLGVPARWSSARGRAVIQRSIDRLRAHGATRIVLAGLSQGALGASVHARALRGQIDGVVLVSGVARRARVPGVPVLVIHGTRDTWTARAPAAALARRARRRGTFAQVPGGHFVFLQNREVVRNHIAQWLSNLPARAPISDSDTTRTRG